MGTLRKTVIFNLFFFFVAISLTAQENLIKKEILAHGEAIRQAFLNEDLSKIELLHHPEVIKALGYTNVQNGREAVMTGLEETLENYQLEFVENFVESVLIKENLAIEQTRFAIKGTPKQGGDPFIFKGRTLVTYVRYADSPTGWATIREIIQPATE